MIVTGILLIDNAIYFINTGRSHLEFHGVGDFPLAFSHVKDVFQYTMILVVADAIIIAIPLLWIWMHRRINS